ncbi:MAG: hypothetical protein EAZ62_05765 [Sphingobacteriia bacterium]|nr:MAG: hypothetical protein EAZ62_05765 [Sphingobacteriia bacterium]
MQKPMIPFSPVRQRLLTFVVGIFMAALTPSAQAQVMNSKYEWLTIKSANLRCWECKEKLEGYLTKANHATLSNGIVQWKVNLLQAEIKLQFRPERTNPDEIRTVINNAGFDADAEKAEETTYAKLPAVCKRPEEGGGPKNNKPCHQPPPQP